MKLVERPSESATWFVLVLSLSWLGSHLGCARQAPQPSPQLDGAVCKFDIHWPPRDPADPSAATAQPLLRGAVSLAEGTMASGASQIHIAVTITRPARDIDRQFWNSQLAYADLAWMEEVRVWDTDSQWLWPNLPYLLRRHGEERVERYGGIDPGKQVDNDFAAVLIRNYDASGTVESVETKDTPLVSANWHAAGLAESNIHSVLHVAKSDSFVVHLGGNDRPDRGQLKIWLIYADFLGSRPPASWPSQREWAGGILAYVEIDWEKLPGQPCRGTLRHCKPERGTGFPWEQWSSGDHSPTAVARLQDISE